MVSGYKGIPLRPMASPLYMMFEFHLHPAPFEGFFRLVMLFFWGPVALCWFTTLTVGLCSQLRY